MSPPEQQPKPKPKPEPRSWFSGRLNLEQQKKRAKELLRAVQADDPAGRARLASFHPGGFATVTESKCDDVPVGTQVYGFLPVADELVVKPGKIIKLVGKGKALGHSLASDPEPVYVILRLGTDKYCMRFGGDTFFKRDKKFMAKKAPAPEACPLP